MSTGRPRVSGVHHEPPAPLAPDVRRRLEEFPTDELPDQAVADHAWGSDMAEVVRQALDRLPQRMRTAVMLRYFEDMTEPEIASALGISLEHGEEHGVTDGGEAAH
jgi:RNA polymerase sigma factor (sigma-70 family)